jgi:outer membrane protein TolC
MRHFQRWRARDRWRIGVAIAVGLVLPVAWTSLGGAGEAPSEPPDPSIIPLQFTLEPGKPLQLTLEQAVRSAVVGSLRVQSSRLSLDSARLGVPSAEAAFHPNLTLNASRTGTEASSRGIPAGSQTVLSSTFGASLTNKFLTGTNVTLSQNATRGDSTPTDQSSTSGLTLTVSQPLLRGFGLDVNRASIDQAKNNLEVAIRELEARLADVVSGVEGAYLDLLLSVEDRKVRELALERAKDQREINRFLIEVGRLPARELVAAESAVSSAELEVAVAQNAVENARRALLRLLNADPVEVMPADPLIFTPAIVEPAASLETALRRRPELARSRIAVENARINVMTAKNSALYDLNLNGSVGSSGAGSTVLSQSLRRIWDVKDTSWNVGATLTIPLDNAANRNAFLTAQNGLRQAELDLKDTEQTIRLDLDNAIKTLQINAGRVGEAQRGLKLAEDRLETETVKFREGRANNTDIINARRDLVTAQSGHLQAVVAYQKSRLALEQARGTVLERWNIQVK